MRILLCIVAIGVVACPQFAAAQQPRAPLSDLIEVAMPHVRSIIPEGRIQFVVAGEQLRARMREWAERNGNGVGSAEAAVECHQIHGCRGIGQFRGFVEIDVVEREPSRAILRLNLYSVGATFGRTVMMVDDVYLELSDEGWRIDKIVRRVDT